jgi:tetratricopeptide (TPR) repeat protein
MVVFISSAPAQWQYWINVVGYLDWYNIEMNTVSILIFVLLVQPQTNSAMALNTLSVASNGDTSQEARSADSNTSYSDPRALNDAAAKLIDQGLTEMDSWHDQTANSKFSQAIGAADQILKLHTGNLESLKNKANALSKQGLLHKRMCRYSAALTSYNEAIGVWDEALSHSSGNLECLTGKALTLDDLVRLHVVLGQYSAARKNVDEAMKIYQEALVKAPASAAIRNCQTQTLI